MTERKKGNLADALTTVWFMVFSAWSLMEGYVVPWLVGLGLSLAGCQLLQLVRVWRRRNDRKGK